MRRRLLALVAGVAPLLIASWGWAAGTGRDITTYVVICTTTRSHVAVANETRFNLTLFNAGTLHVNVGRGRQMMTLHVGSAMEFRDYIGGVECQTQGGTGETAVEVLEETR